MRMTAPTLPQIEDAAFSDATFKIRIAGMKRAERAEIRKQTIRGQLAFLIADCPAHEDRPLTQLLTVADNILENFNVTRKRQIKEN